MYVHPLFTWRFQWRFLQRIPKRSWAVLTENHGDLPRRGRLRLAISHRSDLQGDKVPSTWHSALQGAKGEGVGGLMNESLFVTCCIPTYMRDLLSRRTCRLLQVVRSIRLVRFLSALRALVLSVVDAWRDFFWRRDPRFTHMHGIFRLQHHTRRRCVLSPQPTKSSCLRCTSSS